MDYKVTEEYTDKDIKVLKGLEPVKKRPGMYIGGVDSKGLHHLIWEILDNSIDEAMAGHCKKIFLEINKDYSITITDDGRGIPTGIHPETQISTIETIFTTLHSGGKFENSAYKVSGGLHGVGASVVNALSNELEVWVSNSKGIYYQKFVNGGIPVDHLKKIDVSNSNYGTKIRFLPNFKIFEGISFEYNKIEDRLQELAFLNKDIKIEYVNYINDVEKQFYYSDGIKSYLELKLDKRINVINKIIHFEQEFKNIVLECAFTYISDSTSEIYSYCNNIKTSSGGSHEEGFKTSLTKVINKYGIDNKLIPKNLQILGEDCRDGLVAILSLRHPNPQFEGQTKERLGNIDARTAVAKMTYSFLTRYFNENPSLAQNIVHFVINSAKARIATKQARQAVRNKISNPNIILPGKLSDCSSKIFYERELFLVEGDSAGGSAKLARDKNFQAILPLRGKVINSQKEPSFRVFKNNEIQHLIKAIGVNYKNVIQTNNAVNEEMVIDISKLRYDRIIIMTDADVDGSHISILLLTFFINYFSELIAEGHIYLARPPLFKVVEKGKDVYFYSDDELNEFIDSHTEKKYDIQRYKGLGEMNPDQLWDTTMDPEKRKIVKISVEDQENILQLFEDLMGVSGAQKRKEFIMENAQFVEEIYE